MGRIRLEWDIESQQIDKSDSEDPKLKWARRRGLFRLLLLICILVGLVIAVLLFAQNRLEDVERQLDQLLLDTVEAEVAAIRIGDFDTFMNLQRSATDDWLNLQQITFQNYEYLKSNADLQLTGRVTDTEIIEQRGRALVEEIVNGVPYTHVWFYWRYADGWRHVPPDYTFWGEEQSIESERLTINYRDVDTLYAQQVSDSLNNWIETACSALQCGGFPQITVDIRTNSPVAIGWESYTSWTLLMQSPYIAGARSDLPFDTPLQIQTATLLAERLFAHKSNNLEPVYPHDVYQLRQSAISWMVGQFVQLDTNSYLMDSIVDQYGAERIGQLVSLLGPTSEMNVIQQVVQPPIAQANLDWRDFITWRLATESELISSRQEAEWLNLYDTSDEAVRVVAYERFNAGTIPQQQVAIAQQFQTSFSGLPQLRVTVRVGSGDTFRDEIILFNLVDNIWKRAS